MDHIDFKSKNGFEYQYLPDKKYITYNNERYSSKEYHHQKQLFLHQHNMFNSKKPNLVTDYDVDIIKGNLANLRMLLIEVTDDCNLACEYCGYGKLYNNYDRRHSKSIDFGKVKTLIDYLYTFWVSPMNVSFNNIITIGFYGGEPLMEMDIIRKTIDYIEQLNLSSINFQYNMTTNGVLLDKHIDYLVEKNFSLLISLDGNKLHNSYRVTQNGKESFELLHQNIKNIQSLYPGYYEDKVNFNSVLHNKNDAESVIFYIKEEFGKTPRTAELNPIGIADEKIEEFYTMFRNRDVSKMLITEDNKLNEEVVVSSLEYTQLNYFYDAILSNSFDSYTDLFTSEEEKQFIPTGTCQPFHRKIFLTVNGKILPCERVGHNDPLGNIENGDVKIDFEEVQQIYRQKYNQIIKQCSRCINWKNCTLCVFHIPQKSGRLICDRFNPTANTADYYGGCVSILEEIPLLFNELYKQVARF